MEALWRALSRLQLADRELGDVLDEVTRLANEHVPGAESTSITLVRGDVAVTAAHVGEMSLAADELQYERGYGPCLDAGRAGVQLRVDEMRTETRWPDYAARVLDVGVLSSLSTPLPYQGSSIGALNIYSTRPAAFASEGSAEAAREVAEAVGVAVANADAHAKLGEHARNMQLAMESRAVIEQAKGVLMAQRRVDADAAFDLLRDASQRYNRKLRDIAAGIVSSTHQPR
ncbi:GAF domain-containing protein [Geodermatophilus bullaregiensis]|uniref:GAF and ANTAR domain-containing protein n=1 Tax=Geodermatophilus bullaregiensis TaxID=1564160 RepID=UPI00195B79E7|nr:GAF and ANTAR domain-containing protein [Geodermatophilus bullaregiensis]MBM7806670.1 GAF domain-containing protein [Geodermatophilus bullaregiensis]